MMNYLTPFMKYKFWGYAARPSTTLLQIRSSFNCTGARDYTFSGVLLFLIHAFSVFKGLVGGNPTMNTPRLRRGGG